ncbi:substrate-binding domain-containing protein [Corynebacterium uropygiale]|uniref:Substrate-binding domain-containing protein n=1 Tax=Corynebacterium uropygiale TaxID=1775911 RepID=A0A9X1QRA4_9CORY|nr:substrate-binding domain-containing protein [Corynebacterium uropygiale]
MNHYFSSLATAVQREALAVGLHTIVLTSNEDPATLDALVRGLSQHSIDGLLCVPLEESRAAVEDVASAMPVVLIDRSLPGSALPAVTSDPVPGVSAAVELLARRELTPIGYLSGPLDTSTGRERLDALTAAVAAVGLPPQHIYHGGYQEEQGVQGAEALLRQGVRTLFAGDSMMTVGVLRACHGQGLRIPEDIAVVGFDPHPAFELQPRPITIIDQHADAMASLAFGLLLQLMEKGPPGGRRHLRTTTTLIERESTDTGGEV